AGRDRVEEERIVARGAEIDGTGHAVGPRARAARRRERGEVRVLEEDEGQDAAGVEVGGADDERAEARLAEVLGPQGDETAAELDGRRRGRGEGGAPRGLPEAAAQPLPAAARVEEGLEGLPGAAAGAAGRGGEAEH